MPKRFDDCDRVALVTGSDSGVGEAIAVALANGEFDVGRLDLTRLPGAALAVDEPADAHGGRGVLVNNAGTGARRMIDAGSGGRIIKIISAHEHGRGLVRRGRRNAAHGTPGRLPPAKRRLA
jgi:NAD(P)-dependent dehydrogenase (short-subunit alcohol dehydrogenase family)